MDISNFATDIVLTIFSTVIVIYTLRIAGEIFSHSTGLLASAFAGAVAGTIAKEKTAKVVGGGGAGVTGGTDLKKALANNKPASTAQRSDTFQPTKNPHTATHGADPGKGVFNGAAKQLKNSNTSTQTQKTPQNPDGVPGVSFDSPKTQHQSQSNTQTQPPQTQPTQNQSPQQNSNPGPAPSPTPTQNKSDKK